MKQIASITAVAVLLLNCFACEDKEATDSAKTEISLERTPREIIQDGIARICAELDDRLNPIDRELISESDFVGMGYFHHGLGTYIRNNYGLWSGETPLGKAFHDLGVKHADYASGVVLNEYWRHVHGKPSELDKEISDALASLETDRKAYEEATKREEAAGPIDPFAPIK